ncbi:kinase-like domain-containing protein [Hypoxylon crocopeplum]|nr:kinase-like domain-containing protein [Hypoxylon crocopeplum]
MSYFSEEGPELVSKRIQEFFDKTPLWKFEGIIGTGANGIVFQLQHQGETPGKRLALKICPQDIHLDEGKAYDEDDDTDELDQLVNEAQWLKRLRGCAHIVQSITIGNEHDPLAQTHDGVQPHMMTQWIYMEHIGNGTVNSLVERHREQFPGELLPNRLLWRLFMCLARACLEMAYHDAEIDGQKINLNLLNEDILNTLNTIPPGQLAHRDMTGGNTLVGRLTLHEAPEHDISPPLKLIDFGTARSIDPAQEDLGRTGSQINIFDVGEIMRQLILLDIAPAVKGNLTMGNQTIETWGDSLLQNRDALVQRGMDPELIDLTCLCLACDHNARPLLLTLVDHIGRCIVAKGPNGIQRETNAAIRRRMQAVIFDAPLGAPLGTPLGKRERDDDNDDDDNDDDDNDDDDNDDDDNDDDDNDDDDDYDLTKRQRIETDTTDNTIMDTS